MSELNDKQKLLLALLYTDDSITKELDPIRIMKGLFILSMKIPLVLLNDRYEFIPYLYGPYCEEVYDDINFLRLNGFITLANNSGQSWSSYYLSSKGTNFAKSILSSYDSKLAKFISKIRNFVATNSFDDLLKKVYAAFPDYAINSVFKG